MKGEKTLNSNEKKQRGLGKRGKQAYFVNDDAPLTRKKKLTQPRQGEKGKTQPKKKKKEKKTKSGGKLSLKVLWIVADMVGPL